MNILIIEDETAAAVNLELIVRKLQPNAKVVAVLESVADVVAWVGRNPMPDLVFMDIHLADGDAFRVFDSVAISAPIIFTTAYDKYALEAFKVNSIDYILKPIKEEELSRAFDKLAMLSGSQKQKQSEVVAQMATAHRPQRAFLIPIKDRLVPLSVADIAFCYTAGERVSAHTLRGEQMPIEGSLDALMGKLGATDFFRANRQFIVSRGSISDISVWFGSRLAINLKVATPERIIVSKARVSEFKAWFMQVSPCVLGDSPADFGV